jgi:hypothetical protein
MAEEVEKFKLSKEQMAWTKQHAQKAKIYEMVQGKLMEQMAGVRRLQELAGTLQQGLIRSMQMAPEKKMKELEGQE